MDEKLNFLPDLLSEKELGRYNTVAFPKNIEVLRAILDKKLEDDPEYEVFVPMVYCKQLIKMRDKNKPHIHVFVDTYISNKGRVVSLRGNKPLFRAISVSSSGYSQLVDFLGKGKSTSIAVHRAMACTFTPLTKKHEGYHPKELEVNHKDGVTTNFALSNLEWMTHIENVWHSIETGLSSFKPSNTIKVSIIRGKYKGIEFLLSGPDELKKHGMDQGAVSNVINGKLKSHKNCVYAWATVEEEKKLPVGATRTVIKDLMDTNPLAKFKFVGTCIATGVVVEAVGEKKLGKLGFSVSGVKNMVNGRSGSSGGYTWVKVLLPE